MQTSPQNTHTKVDQIRRAERGFTILEVMVVLTLLAVAAAFVGPQIFSKLDEGNVTAAQIQIRSLSNALRDYRRVCHRYPTSEQGLEALVVPPSDEGACKRFPEEGFLSDGKVPKDPWDNDYIYEADGRKFIIFSLGRDGIEGGEGVDADIRSDQLP